MEPKELIKAPVMAQEPAAIVTKKDIDEWLFGTGTKLTEQQKNLFYAVALASNLNPLKREIYAISYGSNFNIITGYEVYLKRAERTGLLEWWTATVEKRDNEWVGVCTIKRKDHSEPTTIEAWFNEYNQGTPIWKSKPRTMTRKVSISQGFRLVFSEDLGGLPYTKDEITSGDIKDVEFTPIEDMTEKAGAEDAARADLDDRKQKAAAYLSTKGKGIMDAQNYLKTSYADWTDDDLDALKKWAKAGFPVEDEDEVPV